MLHLSDVSSSDNSTFLSGLQNTPSVKYEDVLQATSNFTSENILGRGGYGIVYKGVWKHLEVAIKRIQGRKDNSLEVTRNIFYILYFFILATKRAY